jgi:DNA-binding XRE family transcriptional regulator
MHIIHNDKGLKAYLKTRWLIHAMMQLEAARKDRGYTQQDLAFRLGTTPSVISRTEADSEGSISLKRYAECLFVAM